MAHSIELLLDESSDNAIRSIWEALADAGLPSHMNIRSGTNRPHITLLAAEQINPGVDDVLRSLCSALPLPCVIGAPTVFGQGRLTLVRFVVPSLHLLALHKEVYRMCQPHLPTGSFGHSAPGRWSPHVTLGRRYLPAQIGDALANIAEVSRDIPAHAVGLRRWEGDRQVEHLLIG